MYIYAMLSFGYGSVAMVSVFAVTELAAFLRLQIKSRIKGIVR